MTKLLFPMVAAIFQFAAADYTDPPELQPLSPEEIERLASWKEGDEEAMWELSGQFEGDMVLEPEQRLGIANKSYRWHNKVIPYEFAPNNFTKAQIKWIEQSLKELNDTCLKVRPKTDKDEDYVIIIGNKNGCWSCVGRRGGHQTLNLEASKSSKLNEGCLKNGTIVHQFLHAAGFYHQHSAPNRDKHIQIIWKNIKCEKQINFQFRLRPNEVDTYDLKYDYGSLLHYGRKAYSRNDEDTIVPVNSSAHIGQRHKMSKIDKQKVKLMYCPRAV